jgi:tetratricopeptide (TPR) repeat protein/tRNA A-37 threonylcarbamoyl transferase component Bud32
MPDDSPFTLNTQQPEEPAVRPQETVADLSRPTEQDSREASPASRPEQQPADTILLRQDQCRRWQKGERPPVEDYLTHLGGMPADRQAEMAIDLIYNEVLLREQRGETPRLEEYLGRFPQYAVGLRRQFEVHHGLQDATIDSVAPPSLPSVVSAPSREQETLDGDSQGMPVSGSDLPGLATIDSTPPESADWVPNVGGATVASVDGRPSDANPDTAHLGAMTAGPGKGGESPAAADGSEDRFTVAGYEILGELGQGGMGVVYKARHIGLKRIVALKMVRSPQASRGTLARFKAEAEAVARLQHPNIVQVYEVGELGTGRGAQPYFALEFVPGGSLDNKLDGTPLDSKQAARLTRTLALAVHAAHEKNIVHRDLKPANILLAPPGPQDRDQPLGVPKITDFGLAKDIETDSGRTRSGEIMGTPSYMAPEQAEGRIADIGRPTDVYALGAILYELLTGRAPFRASTVWDTLEQVRNREPVQPHVVSPGCPRDLETICLKCLQKEPRKRYATALQLADDLGHYLAGEPIGARPVGRVERTVKWCRRHPARAAVVFLLFLLAGGVTGFAPWHIHALQAEITRLHRLNLRADVEKWLGEGEAALARKEQRDVREAERLFTQARDRIADSDAAADADLATLRTQAGGLIEKAENLLKHWEEGENVRADYERFFKLRDEAFFLLERDVFTGAAQASPRDSQARSREALDLFLADGEIRPAARDFLTAAQLERLQTGLYEVSLLRAEALARQGGAETDRQALAGLDQAERLVSGTRSVPARRARYLARLGEEDRAAAEQARADGLKPRTALDWFLTGHDRGLGDEASARAAVADFDRALDEQPDLFWAHFFRALACQKLRNPGEARVSLTLCLHEQPGFFWAYHLRGLLSAEVGDFPAAEADFQRAERSAQDGDARYVLHVDRGFAAFQQAHKARRDTAAGRPPAEGEQVHLRRAASEFRKAITLNEKLSHAHVNLAAVLREQGDLPGAAAELDEAIRLGPGRASLYRTRAAVRRKLHKWDGALDDLKLALEDKGASSSARFRDNLERAAVLFEAGRFEQVAMACEEMIKGWSDEPEGHRLRGEALFQLANHAEPKERAARFRETRKAFDLFLQKARLQPARARLDAAFWQRRAHIDLELGDYKALLEDCTQAVSMRPDAESLAARGWAYLLNDLPALAEKDFAAALEADPHQSDAYTGRGLARVKRRLLQLGLADADQAVAQDGESVRVLYRAAHVYAQAVAVLDEDPRPSDRESLERRSAYADRAVALLKRALKAADARKQQAVWLDRLRRDSALQPLQRNEGYMRLCRHGLGTPP